MMQQLPSLGTVSVLNLLNLFESRGTFVYRLPLLFTLQFRAKRVVLRFEG